MKALFTIFFLSAALASLQTNAQCTTMDILVDVVDITCSGNIDGSITVTPQTGTPPYAYVWSNAYTDLMITDLAAGNYAVTITDANGCSGYASYTINEPMPLNLSIMVDSSTFGSRTLLTNVTGGTAPFDYAWSDGATTSSVSHQAAEFMNYSFSVTVTDANLCTVEGTVSGNETPCGVMFTTTYDTVSNTFFLAVDSTILNSFSATALYTWDFGDGNTANQQFPNHSYTTNDVYNVCLFIADTGFVGCGYCHNIGIDSLGNVYTRIDQSGFSMQVVPYNFTGVQQAQSFGFDFYPNPVGDVATVSLHSDHVSGCVIEIFNHTGQRVKTTHHLNTGNNVLTLSLEDLPEGFYMLTLQTEKQKATRPFVR